MARRPKLPKPKLPKLPKIKLPGIKEILGIIVRLIKKPFQVAAGLIKPYVAKVTAPVNAFLDRVPGMPRIKRYLRRKRRRLSKRWTRLKEIKDAIPPPMKFPGWAIRGITGAIARPVSRWKIILFAGAALLAIIFIAVVQFPLTTNPTFCGSCHSMRPEMYTWRVSSHRRVTCYSCHVKPGRFWLIRDHLIDGPLGMYKEFIDGYHDPFNFNSHVSVAKMPVMNCQRCHSPGNRRFTTTRGLKMNHDKHLKLGVRCTICHNRITHPMRGYKNNMKMQGCFRCHGANKNEEFVEELKHLSHEKEEYGRYAKLAEAIEKDKPKPKCSLCHEPEWNLKPRSHLLADWAPTKSYEVPTYSGESQREQWEYQSLKISLQPKPAKLKGIYQHARYAKANPSYCYMCHNKENFCSKCHNLTMPHVRPWWDRHGETVLNSFKDSLGAKPSTISENAQKIMCSRCHRTESFCLDCHKKTVFPHATPWAPQHGKIAKKPEFKPVCVTCHNAQRFCNSCHNGVAMPHSKRWLGKHFDFLKNKKPKICMRCHVKSQCEKCHSRHGGHIMWTILDETRFTKPSVPKKKRE